MSPREIHLTELAADELGGATAEQESRNVAKSRISTAERSLESERAEACFPDWQRRPPAERPLMVARSRAATVFFETIQAHGYSTARMADRLGIAEKGVWQYCNGEKALPLGVIFAIPRAVALTLLERVQAELGGRPSLMNAIGRAREGIAQARAAVANASPAERAAITRALAGVQRDVADLVATLLETEGK